MQHSTTIGIECRTTSPICTPHECAHIMCCWLLLMMESCVCVCVCVCVCAYVVLTHSSVADLEPRVTELSSTHTQTLKAHTPHHNTTFHPTVHIFTQHIRRRHTTRDTAHSLRQHTHTHTHTNAQVFLSAKLTCVIPLVSSPATLLAGSVMTWQTERNSTTKREQTKREQRETGRQTERE